MNKWCGLCFSQRRSGSRGIVNKWCGLYFSRSRSGSSWRSWPSRSASLAWLRNVCTRPRTSVASCCWPVLPATPTWWVVSAALRRPQGKTTWLSSPTSSWESECCLRVLWGEPLLSLHSWAPHAGFCHTVGCLLFTTHRFRSGRMVVLSLAKGLLGFLCCSFLLKITHTHIYTHSTSLANNS